MNFARVIFSATLLLISSSAMAGLIPTKLVVFGDSLSTNSLEISSIPSTTVVSYANQVALNLGIEGTNYAQAGRRSIDMLGNLETLYLPSLEGGKVKSGTVHIINIGINDGWWGLELNQGILDDTINNIAQMVELLTGAGAQTIYLADYMNRGGNAAMYAASIELGFNFDEVSALIGNNVKNASQQVLDAVLNVNSNVLPLGLGDFVEEVGRDPAEWGFDPSSFLNCFFDYRIDNPGGSGLPCREDPVHGFHGTNPDDTQLFYFDGGHLTFAANDAVGNYITERILEDSAMARVPVPAPFVLIAIGLIGLAVTRRNAS